MTFVRESGDDRVVCMMNVSPYAIHADFNTGIYAGTYRDAVNGGDFELVGHVERDMAPWEYHILTK